LSYLTVETAKPLGREMSSGFMGKRLKETLPPTVDAGAGLVNI
jgi:hypothetical protein